jgi:cell division protein ZapA (FtsZ GTPase activity inhibitor)
MLTRQNTKSQIPKKSPGINRGLRVQVCTVGIACAYVRYMITNTAAPHAIQRAAARSEFVRSAVVRVVVTLVALLTVLCMCVRRRCCEHRGESTLRQRRRPLDQKRDHARRNCRRARSADSEA